MLKWEEIQKYIKSHKFHTIVIVALAFVGILELAQFRVMTRNYLLTKENKKEIELLRSDLEVKNKDLNEKIHNTDISVNARIDVVDSAIKVNEKRKMLVKKVRDAITENTTTQMDVRTLNRIAMAVIDYSYTYNLPVANVLAQMRYESNFNTNAKSDAGAEGLMQIMPETREYLMLKMKSPLLNSWDINDNVMMGCFYMAEQMAKFGNWEDALRAFNAGPTAVRRFKAGESKSYLSETQKYVPEILKWKEIFKRYGLD